MSERNFDKRVSSGFSLKGLATRVGSALNHFNKAGAWDFSGYNLLPHEIRYALAEHDQTLSGPEISNLSKSTAYAPAAFYLLVKGLEDFNTGAQRELLTQARIAEAYSKNYAGDLSDIVSSNTALLPEDRRVKAAKISQISRMGPDLWEQRFNKIEEDLNAQHKGREKFVLAYASLMGLRQLSRFSRQSGEPVHFLVEKWFEDPSEEVCGYTLIGGSTTVERLPRNFERPADFVTIDDTVSTWSHFRRMWAFLKDQDPLDVVIDPTKTMVVDKTSSDNTANAPRKISSPYHLLMG